MDFRPFDLTLKTQLLTNAVGQILDKNLPKTDSILDAENCLKGIEEVNEKG